jgi:hypothetical protein
LFVVMATLATMVQERVIAIKPDNRHWLIWHAGPDSAQDMKYVLRNELVVSTGPILRYTRAEVDKAQYVLATQWYLLEPHPDLLTYLHMLLRRACVLVATPDSDIMDLHDEQEIEKQMIERTRIGMTLVRMLLLAEFASSRRPAPALSGPYVRECEPAIASVRAYMDGQVKLLASTREAKSELAAVFPRFAVFHGDIEAFVKTRGMESARAASVLMSVRSETQQAIGKLHQFLLIENLLRRSNDEDPAYFNRITRYEHIYAILLQTYAFGVAFRGLRTPIDFLRDFVVLEHDLPIYLRKINLTKEPVLIMLFGRLHVYHNNVVIVCTSVAMALVVWLRVVLFTMKGMLMRNNVSAICRQLLGIQGGGEAANTVHAELITRGVIECGGVKK